MSSGQGFPKTLILSVGLLRLCVSTGKLIRAKQLEVNTAILVDSKRFLEQRNRLLSFSGLQQGLAHCGLRW